MAKIRKSDEWDSTPFVLGEYRHKKNGKMAKAEASTESKYDWAIDKGKVVNHPIFRMKVKMVEQGTGNYFFNKSLKDYELVDDSRFIPNSERAKPIGAIK